MIIISATKNVQICLAYPTMSKIIETFPLAISKANDDFQRSQQNILHIGNIIEICDFFNYMQSTHMFR